MLGWENSIKIVHGEQVYGEVKSKRYQLGKRVE